jgi:hypothetical protein
MGTELKKICFLNGSLRGKQSSSIQFINELNTKLGDHGLKKEFISVRLKGYDHQLFKTISEADIFIIVFPLYSYCLPGSLIRLFEEYYEYCKTKQISREIPVYVIVNCGYVDPKINTEAIRVIKNFCLRVGFTLRFSIAIGCGPAVLYTKFIDIKLHSALKRMARDIKSPIIQKREIIFLRPLLPRIIMDTVRMHLDRNALNAKNKKRL